MRDMGKRKGLTKICICGTSFYIRPYAIKENNYCSRSCSSVGLYKQPPKICTICATEYRVPPSQERHRGISKYCSNKCKGDGKAAAQIGENNAMWNGGVSKENHRLRASKRFKDWRTAVFIRDDYTCVSCGKHGGYLEPDHIMPFAYFPDLRFDINNGRTMCKPCHKLTDTYGVKAQKLYG